MAEKVEGEEYASHSASVSVNWTHWRAGGGKKEKKRDDSQHKRKRTKTKQNNKARIITTGYWAGARWQKWTMQTQPQQQLYRLEDNVLVPLSNTKLSRWGAVCMQWQHGVELVNAVCMKVTDGGEANEKQRPCAVEPQKESKTVSLFLSASCPRWRKRRQESYETRQDLASVHSSADGSTLGDFLCKR